jgi:hypothetical protein
MDPLISFQAGAYQFSALALKRTSRLHRKMSANDPKRTWAGAAQLPQKLPNCSAADGRAAIERKLARDLSVSDPKRTQQVDCHVPPVSIFAFDLGQSAFEFVGPKYSKR